MKYKSLDETLTYEERIKALMAEIRQPLSPGEVCLMLIEDLLDLVENMPWSAIIHPARVTPASWARRTPNRDRTQLQRGSRG